MRERVQSVKNPARSRAREITRVCVEHNTNGIWKVQLPDRGERITCETFDDAQRIAYLCAAHAQPCELIVHYAYHRVVRRELISTR